MATLFQAAADGRPFEWAKLALANKAGDTFTEFSFTDCFLTSVKTVGKSHDGPPLYEVGMNFATSTFSHLLVP